MGGRNSAVKIGKKIIKTLALKNVLDSLVTTSVGSQPIKNPPNLRASQVPPVHNNTISFENADVFFVLTFR